MYSDRKPQRYLVDFDAVRSHQDLQALVRFLFTHFFGDCGFSTDFVNKKDNEAADAIRHLLKPAEVSDTVRLYGTPIACQAIKPEREAPRAAQNDARRHQAPRQQENDIEPEYWNF